MLTDAVYSLIDLVLDSSPASVGLASIGLAIVFFYIGR